MCARGTGPCLTWRFSWKMNISISILIIFFHFWISEHLRTSLTSVRVKPINHPPPQKKTFLETPNSSIPLSIPSVECMHFTLQSIFSLLPLLYPSSHYFFHYFYYYFRYHRFLLNDHTPHDPCYKFPVINFLPPWSSNSQLILSFSSSMIFEVFLLLMNNYKTKPLCSYYFSLFSNHLTIALISSGVHWPHT